MAGKAQAIPMNLVHRYIAAGRDMNVHRTDLGAMALMLPYCDDVGVVGVDETGQIVSDPKYIAEQLGAGVSSVMRSLARLERLGYLNWDRAWSREKRAPIR